MLSKSTQHSCQSLGCELRRFTELKNTFLDKLTGNILYLVIIGLFLIEFSAGLAIAHLDSVHECQASGCVIERVNSE
jgi:hypothetical protein